MGPGGELRHRWAGVGLVVSLACSAAVARVLPDRLRIERILANATPLAALVQAPTDELWLLERDGGRIRIVAAGIETGTLVLEVDPGCPRGLIDVAFPPDYAASGRALVSLREPGRLAVVEVLRTAAGRVRGATLFEIAGGCRTGGGLVAHPDGTLLVGIGDLDDPSAAQDPTSLAGKVLRLAADGSIPPDNPDPASPVFARGFRDVVALALNPDTARPGGTLYAADAGDGAAAVDELNAVAPGGNHGWDVVSGNSGGAFDDPLLDLAGTGLETLEVLSGGETGPGEKGALVYTRTGDDRIARALLVGDDKTALSATDFLFDPLGDTDGSPDTGCPGDVHGLMAGRDGMLYTASASANPGVWRIYRDRPGPREVSPAGSPFPLRVDKADGRLLMAWEHLGPVDGGRPARNGGQRAETYRIWEGSLPIAAYDHAAVLSTDGTRDGPARRTAPVEPGAGDRYFLVSAQGDNLEGGTGSASDGTPRGPGSVDHCADIGRFTGDCIDDFRHPATGEALKLIDYNPLSSTYLEALSIRDFRGRVVQLDISADNCFWCNLQAPTYREVDLAYRGRGFTLLTILNASLSGPVPFPDQEACADAIRDWAFRHDEHTPVLCDVDLDGNGFGDVSRQYWHLANEAEPCGGTPQNFFVDTGGTIFAYRCSYTPGPEVVELIAPEVQPDVCE